MDIPAGKSFRVRVQQIDGLGSPWIVRLYKTRFFFNRLISSDWFLDGDQATKFARQLSHELSHDGDGETILKRQPGWTLHRPPH